jgi:hypothetical protein
MNRDKNVQKENTISCQKTIKTTSVRNRRHRNRRVQKKKATEREEKKTS